MSRILKFGIAAGIAIVLAFLAFLLRPVLDHPTRTLQTLSEVGADGRHAELESDAEGSTRKRVTPPLEPVQSKPNAQLLVEDSGYHPQPETTIRIWADGHLADIGRTDSKGILALTWPSLEHLELLAEKPGYGTESIELQPPFPDSLTMVLFENGSLHGTVVRPDKLPVGKGIRVLAIPDYNRFPSKQFFARVCQGGGAIPLALTETDGSYLIAGLRRGQKYRLIANGDGVATTGSPGPFEAGDATAHDIVVSTIYALRVGLYNANTSRTARRLRNEEGTW